MLVPCGHTLASVCPACAERASRCGPRSAGKAGTSRTNPTSPGPATDDQKWWITQRAEAQQVRDLIAATGRRHGRL